MSTLAPPRPKPIVPASQHREAMADFVCWAAAQLRAIDRETPEPIDFQKLPAAELIDRLHDAGPVHVRPVGQPVAVADVASRLFDAYTIDGGQIQLAGCQLTDVPFVRLSYEAGDDVVRHVFVSRDGDVVPAELVEQLGLTEIEPIPTNQSRPFAIGMESLIVTARNAVATTTEPLAIAVVWARHAAGKLQFTVREATAELAFAGWASLLEAPPFVGPHSRSAGFHLAATDDGRIDLASEIAKCEQSGQRVLTQELVTCCVTGKRALPEFTDMCPTTGSPALVDQFATCAVCRERVSKASLVVQTCSACRDLSRIKKDDPRLVWIMGEHPGLARWSRWRLAETSGVYIARAEGLWKRLLVVAARESLTVRHVAIGTRFSRDWRTVSSAEKEKLLT